MTWASNVGVGVSENFAVNVTYGQFPIRDDINDGESGHGYVLRMAVANLLNGIPAVKKMLGKTRFAVFEESDADRVAIWFGANPKKLAVAFGSTGIGRNSEDFLFCGNTLNRSYFINRMHPRLCVRCIGQTGRCRSEWELSLVTSCAHHGSLLLDRCPYCLGELSWNRPAVSTCQCGSLLAGQGEPALALKLERQFSRWVAIKIADAMTFGESQFEQPSIGYELPLMRLLNPLTLNGGLHLVYALGTAERCSRSDFTVTHRKKSSIAAAQEILRRGSALLEHIQCGDPVDFKQSSLTVVIKLLAESAAACNHAADKSIAYSLITTLLRFGGRSNWKSRYPQLSQMDLFS